MADIVNLRRARKDKARADKEARAAENRAKFGRTSEQKRLAEARERLAERQGGTSARRQDGMTAVRIVKRSVAIAGHRTSVSLEQPFWDELQAIAKERGVSAQALIAGIDAGRAGQNLSSAIRVFVLAAVKARGAPA
jgi:predicted DNA-binding ribbon-helix-helix protein